MFQSVMSALTAPCRVGCRMVKGAVATAKGGSQPVTAVGYASNGVDSAEISPHAVGRSLMRNLFSALGYKPQNGVIDLDGLEAAAQAKSSDLQATFADLLQQAGINLPQTGLKVTTDAEGNLRLAEDHPQREQIEAILNQDPELGNQFRAVSSALSLVKAGREGGEFQAAFAEDPYAAVAEYAYLLGRQEGEEPFTLTVTAPTESR